MRRHVVFRVLHLCLRELMDNVCGTAAMWVWVSGRSHVHCWKSRTQEQYPAARRRLRCVRWTIGPSNSLPGPKRWLFSESLRCVAMSSCQIQASSLVQRFGVCILTKDSFVAIQCADQDMYLSNGQANKKSEFKDARIGRGKRLLLLPN